MRKVVVTGFAVTVLAAALVVAGCGSGSSGSSTALSAADGMTAAQILAKADGAMHGVKSARIAATLGVAASSSGSSAGASGPTALLLHVNGAAGDVKGAPAAELTMTLRSGLSTTAFGVKATGHHTWLGYRGTWYLVPASTTGAAGSGASLGSPGVGAGSSAALAGLGIDPQAWAQSSAVTVEQRAGAKVYHVVTTADTARIMSDLVKLLTSSAVAKAAAQNSSAGMELNLLEHDPALLQGLEKALVSASAQEWVDAGTFLVDQGQLDARFRFASGTAATGFTIHVVYQLSGFGQPVKVVAPRHALPFKQLSKGLSALGAAGAAGL
jgi:hypothetical protein